MRILLDMDEVLADFVGGVLDLWGVDIETLYKYWDIGEWDISKPLGKMFGKKLTEEVFWQHIDGYEDFWYRLQPMPWLDDLLLTVGLLTDDIYIVSSPSRCKTSHIGKLRWIENHLPKRFHEEQRLIITKHKHLLANHGTILIDDRDSNVDNFIKAGGMGLVFPRYHNRCHEYRHDPVSFVCKNLGVKRHACYNPEPTDLAQE